MKVYVIEKGSYSERHVIGVVKTLKEAEDLIKFFEKENDYVTFEEFDTDQFKQKLRFIVERPFDNWIATFDDYNSYNRYKNNSEVYPGCYVVYSDSYENAIKIAQNMYLQKYNDKKE